MGSAILTVCFGGQWKKEDGIWVYVGNKSSKAFVIEKDISVEGLKRTIVDRFNVDVGKCNVMLSHMHPSNEQIEPFCIDADGDLKAFFKINEMSNVGWSLPLYVVLSTPDSSRAVVDMPPSCDGLPVPHTVSGYAERRTDLEANVMENTVTEHVNMAETLDVHCDEFFGVAFVDEDRCPAIIEAASGCCNDVVEGSDDHDVGHQNDMDDGEDLYHSDGINELGPTPP